MPTWLTLTELSHRGGRYEGTVREVKANRTRNRFRFEDDGKGSTKPVFEEKLLVVFDDGVQWIPNVGALRTLIDRLGAESDRWVGQRLNVYAHKVESIDKKSGEVKSRTERAVAFAAPPLRISLAARPERSDYDDSDEALREAGVLKDKDIRWG